MLSPTVGGILFGGSGSMPLKMPLICSSTLCGTSAREHESTGESRATAAGGARASRTVFPAPSRPTMSTWNSDFLKSSLQKPMMSENMPREVQEVADEENGTRRGGQHAATERGAAGGAGRGVA